MKRRKLGRTGLEVSEIGHGMWGIGGGEEWRDSSDTESKAALKKSFELGVNFFDTALEYNEGHSESLLGGLAKEVGRENLIIASKVPPKNREWPARCGAPVSDTFPPSYIRACTEASLKNLKTDYIDLYQLHVWQDHWLEEDAWMNELLALKKEGKIRYVGVSVNDHDPTSAMLLAQHQIADVVQVIYNIFDPSPDDALIPLCKDANIGIIARCPFDEGALTGNITAQTKFQKGDFREAYFEGERSSEVERRVSKLSELLGEGAETISELALRFCLSNPAISTVIPGMRKEKHVINNAAVSDGRLLSTGMLAKLKSHAWTRNFYP